MRTAPPGLTLLALLAACSSARPDATPSRLQALVVVEASGGSLETEAFVARFLSVLSDSGLGNVADARLAGARLETLRDPESPEAVRFRAAYPGDGYLGLELPPCGLAGRATRLECTVTVVLLSPGGEQVAKFEESASNSTGFTSDSGADPQAEASLAAAKKAARRLVTLLAR